MSTKNSMEQVVEKIQKLLALANSDNENEAKLASKKAHELMIKYNLSASEVEMINKEYINKIVSIEPYTKPHQKYIYSILMSFFC